MEPLTYRVLDKMFIFQVMKLKSKRLDVMNGWIFSFLKLTSITRIGEQVTRISLMKTYTTNS